MNNFSNPDVEKVFNAYPGCIRSKMLFLRQLVLETASEIDEIIKIEETLKWGEPSYLTKCGSTVRMGWKQSKPEQYALYFHCQTKLLDTFKERYKSELNFEGNRAIIFNVKDDLALNELKHCISLSLTYHTVKHLPLLGA